MNPHLVGGLEHLVYFSIYWEFHHISSSHLTLTPSFFRGVGITTTNNQNINWFINPINYRIIDISPINHRNLSYLNHPLDTPPVSLAASRNHQALKSSVDPAQCRGSEMRQWAPCSVANGDLQPTRIWPEKLCKHGIF